MNNIRLVWKEHILIGNRELITGNREPGTKSLFGNTSPMFQYCKSRMRDQFMVSFNQFRALTILGFVYLIIM